MAATEESNLALAPLQEKGIVDRAWEAQDRLEARVGNLGKGKYGRVLRMARKPTPEEYSRTSKITMIGVAALGGLGFLIYQLMRLLPF